MTTDPILDHLQKLHVAEANLMDAEARRASASNGISRALANRRCRQAIEKVEYLQSGPIVQTHILEAFPALFHGSIAYQSSVQEVPEDK